MGDAWTSKHACALQTWSCTGGGDVTQSIEGTLSNCRWFTHVNRSSIPRRNSFGRVTNACFLFEEGERWGVSGSSQFCEGPPQAEPVQAPSTAPSPPLLLFRSDSTETHRRIRVMILIFSWGTRPNLKLRNILEDYFNTYLKEQLCSLTYYSIQQNILVRNILLLGSSFGSARKYEFVVLIPLF